MTEERDAMYIDEDVAGEMGAHACVLGAPMASGIFAADELNMAYYRGYFEMSQFMYNIQKANGTLRLH